MQGTSYVFGSEDLLPDLDDLVSDLDDLVSDLDDLESLGAIAMVEDATDWILDSRLSWLLNIESRMARVGGAKISLRFAH